MPISTTIFGRLQDRVISRWLVRAWGDEKSPNQFSAARGRAPLLCFLGRRIDWVAWGVRELLDLGWDTKSTREQCPSGKVILRDFDDGGVLVKESHSYGMLDVACLMEFAAGKKVRETYSVNRRMIGRARYEKALVDYPDMPKPDPTLQDADAELTQLMGKERRQRAAAQKRREGNPPSDEERRETERQIPFFKAVGSEDLNELRRLLDAGEDPNCVHIAGRFTPLYSACFGDSFRPEKSLEKVRLLLERGADPNLRFNYDSPIDGRLERGLTALMITGNAEVARALIAAGGDVNAANADGVTPLMRAAGRGKAELVRVLLEAGADATARSGNGRTAADFARDKLSIYESNVDGFKPGMRETRIAEFHEVLSLLSEQC
jgi:hypothetical protein